MENVNIKDSEIEFYQVILDTINTSAKVRQIIEHPFTIEKGNDGNKVFKAIEVLKHYSLLEISTIDNNGNPKTVKLTAAGHNARGVENGVRGFVESERQKIQRQEYQETKLNEVQSTQKEYYEKAISKLSLELDEKARAIQKKLQDKQKEFWDSGIARDKRNKWQFWVTTVIAMAAFLKSFGIFEFKIFYLLFKFL